MLLILNDMRLGSVFQDRHRQYIIISHRFDEFEHVVHVETNHGFLGAVKVLELIGIQLHMDQDTVWELSVAINLIPVSSKMILVSVRYLLESFHQDTEMHPIGRS